MKNNIIDTIKMIRACLLANENKPITTQEIFERCSGNIPMDDIYYALQIMVQRKTASRVKRGVYVLTDTNKPIDAYISKKKRKPRQAKAVPFEKQLEQLDQEEQYVDWKDLCQKLQHALAASYVAEENLESQIKILGDEIARRDTIIRYLESRIVL
jgi:hypothetical protein